MTIQSLISNNLAPVAEAGIFMAQNYKQDSFPKKYVYGSPLHIRQIFLNLYGNSIKYNRPGGSIKSSVEMIECDEKTVVYRFVIADTV